MNTTSVYWFIIEPYVYINIADGCVMLYNTLDGEVVESNQIEVIALLCEILQEENCGILLLQKEQLEKSDICKFIQELRGKYMGDLVKADLSKGKPVQILPYINYPNKRNKKYNFDSMKSVLQNLFEVYIHLDSTSDIVKLKTYLESVPNNSAFNIVGNWNDLEGGNKLINFLNRRSAPKYIICFYNNIPTLDSIFNNNFSYNIYVNFPINKLQWEESIRLLQEQDFSFGYTFKVTSLADCENADRLIAECQIKKYRLEPVYTGDNIQFFKEYIYLTKEDILSAPISMKDLFRKRTINENDFGKIHLMPNGDIYANPIHPVLGNICTHNIDEIIQKEIKEGESWLRIRNQAPCNKCVYQDLCPSPSDYEIAIGSPNLCYLK